MDGLATFAWVWILLGLLSGVWMGLRFHDDRWLGGYGSWRRRMVRLGHVSFFGTGGLCLMLAMSERTWFGVSQTSAAFWLLAGSVLMPAVCFLSAWRKPFRHLFALPVCSLVWGVTTYTVGNVTHHCQVLADWYDAVMGV